MADLNENGGNINGVSIKKKDSKEKNKAEVKDKELPIDSLDGEKKGEVYPPKEKDKSKEKYIINKIIKEKMSVAQAENLVAEVNDSNILKKHFLKQVKSFNTSLKKFKEKEKIIGMNKKEEEEIEKELGEIKKFL